MEIIYSRNQQDYLAKKQLPADVEKRVWKCVDVLNDSYGSDRKILEGDGGFVVLVEDEVEKDFLDRAFGVSSHPAEYTDDILTDSGNYIVVVY